MKSMPSRSPQVPSQYLGRLVRPVENICLSQNRIPGVCIACSHLHSKRKVKNMTVGPTPRSPAIHSSGEWTSGVHFRILRLLLHVGPPPCGEIFAARHLLQTFFRAHEGSRADVTHVAALFRSLSRRRLRIAAAQICGERLHASVKRCWRCPSYIDTIPVPDDISSISCP